MNISPSPSVGRGTIIVQPAYFTSNLYVVPLRDDVMCLSHKYIQRYAADPSKPFQLFKDLWKEEGWPWLHFKVFDPRSREAFLKTTLRIFLEGTAPSQAPLKRVVSLFGMYTFFYTQPSSSTPTIHAVSRISIPIDWLTSLTLFPDSLSTPQLSPLRPHAAFVVHTLLRDQIFEVLPLSELSPLNPRELPREFHQPVGATPTTSTDSEATGKRKAGRPSKHERAKKAHAALDQLDKWLKETSYSPQAPVGDGSHPCGSTIETSTRSDLGMQPVTHSLLSTDPVESRVTFQSDKAELLKDLMSGSNTSDDTGQPAAGKSEGREALERATLFILTRMRKLEEDAKQRGLEVGGEGGDLTTLMRVEKAAAEMNLAGDAWRGGLLGLSNGAGN